MLGLSILNSVVDATSSYFKGKQELRKVKLESEKKVIEAKANAELAISEAKKKVIEAKANAELAISEAKIQMARADQTNDYKLDMIAMENMERGYKDDFILAVFISPMIMAFIPGYDTIALKGFKVISQMPDWYIYIIVGMVVVIYGMRGMLRDLINKKLTFGNKQ